jgi:hypothetical protein
VEILDTSNTHIHDRSLPRLGLVEILDTSNTHIHDRSLLRLGLVEILDTAHFQGLAWWRYFNKK